MHGLSYKKSGMAIAFAICSIFAFAKEIPKQGRPPKGLVKQADGHWSPYTAAATPEGATVHIVVKGDTLWDLGKKYLQNPFLWPQIWELNTYIVNPHWIYPGDPIVIKQPIVVTEDNLKKEEAKQEAESKPEPPQPAQEQPAAEQPEITLETKHEYPLVTQEELYCSGYIASENPPTTYLIVGAEEERYKSRFAQGDIVYVNKGEQDGMTPGAEFAILRRMGRVKNMVNGDRVGNYVAELGKLKLLMVHEGVSTAQIVDSCDTILIGDLLDPFVAKVAPMGQSKREFIPNYKTGAASGYIILAKNDVNVLGTGNIVHVNLGRDSGIRPGDYLTVYRKFGGFGPGGPLLKEIEVHPSYAGESEAYTLRKKNAVKQRRMPKRALGELVVFSVQENTATGKIVYNREEITIGDEVILQEDRRAPRLVSKK